MSANVSIVRLNDGREVCLSYGVPVAAFDPLLGYLRTEERFSVTSSRHANTYAGREAATVPADEFAALIAPVTWPCSSRLIRKATHPTRRDRRCRMKP